MHPCDWCTTLRGHEDEKLAEFTRELQRNNFRGWIMQYATVCLFHGRRLIRVLSRDDLELIRRVLATNMQDLEKQLEASDVKVKRGERGGAGVLGFIDEFLVSQRGIGGDECSTLGQQRRLRFKCKKAKPTTEWQFTRRFSTICFSEAFLMRL